MFLSLIRQQPVLSPLCVFIFYDKNPTPSEIDKYNEIIDQYPGYSLLVLQRQRAYQHPSLPEIASHNCIARLVPKIKESFPQFLATQEKEEINPELFKCFMDTLVDMNGENAKANQLPEINNISEWIKMYYPKLSQSADDVVNSMTQTFMSESEKKIEKAKKIVLKLEPGIIKKKVGNHTENVDVCNAKKWTLKLMMDDKAYTLPINGKKSLKAIFVYMLLHPKEKISGFTYDVKEENTRSEVRKIVRTLFPDFEYQDEGNRKIHQILEDFDGLALSKKIGIMKRLVVDESMSVNPFTWIKKVSDFQNGDKRPAIWSFSPPEKVTINTTDFEDAMKEYL